MSIIKATQKKVAAVAKILGQATALKSYRKVAINFLILTVNLIIIVLYFALSKAKVLIVPAREPITHSLRVPLKDVSGSPTEVLVESSQDWPVAADAEIPAVATGKITIRNTTPGRNQILVANTQFQNEAQIIIRTKNQVELAPGQTVTVAAYADQPGLAGEVEPGRFQIVKLPAWRDKIYGEVETKFTGGREFAPMLTQSKYDQAKTELEAKLRELAAAKLKAKDFDMQITKLEATARPGDRDITSFTITATATAKYIAFDLAGAKDLARADLEKNLPLNKTVARVDSDSFTVTPDANGAYLDITFQAIAEPKFPDAVFNKKAIAGKSKEEVRRYFTKITGIQEIEVEFSPFWVRSVPRLDDHVDIEIKK